MAFEEFNENSEDLKVQARELLEANLKYYKLWGFKILMKSTSMMLKIFLLAIVLTIVILFFSIAGALAIGYALDNMAYGFLIVGGIYFIVALFIYYFQNKIVEGPLLANFSKLFFKKYD